MDDETKKLINDFKTYTWIFWAGSKTGTPPCIRCQAPAVTLHEIIPKSLYPEWYTDVFNSVPICQKCHEWAALNGEASRAKLREMVVKRLQRIGVWRPDRVLRQIEVEEKNDGPRDRRKN